MKVWEISFSNEDFGLKTKIAFSLTYVLRVSLLRGRYFSIEISLSPIIHASSHSTSPNEKEEKQVHTILYYICEGEFCHILYHLSEISPGYWMR